jgi:hypothetical protein
LLLLGSKRKGKEVAGVSASSSTMVPISDEEDPIDVGGSGISSNGNGGNATGIPSQEQGHVVDGNDDVEVIAIDQDEPLARKRSKKCTYDVWPYFTKKDVIVEVDGKKYIQTWGHCNFPKCRAKYRAESNQGTTRFRNHLKSTHNIVKGQQQLNIEKDHGKDKCGTTLQV